MAEKIRKQRQRRRELVGQCTRTSILYAADGKKQSKDTAGYYGSLKGYGAYEMNTVELKKMIFAYLKAITSSVYEVEAPAKASYPYVVYGLYRSDTDANEKS